MLPEMLSPAVIAADQATLAHLLRRSIRENTLRATWKDLVYPEAWSFACDGATLPWPPTSEIFLRYIGLSCASRMRGPEPRCESMDPIPPSTVQRRISTWQFCEDDASSIIST